MVDETGASSEWKILSYEPSIDIVKLRGASGLGVKLFADLGVNEQKQVMGWVERKSFNSSKLQVRLEQKTTARKIALDQYGLKFEGEISSLVNEIILENSSSVQFIDVEVRVQAFIQKRQGDREDRLSVEQRFVCDLAPGERRSLDMDTLELRSIRVKNPYSNEDYSGPPTIYVEDQLAGVDCILSFTSSDGERLRREVELKKYLVSQRNISSLTSLLHIERQSP